jgi:hypothetical protein
MHRFVIRITLRQHVPLGTHATSRICRVGSGLRAIYSAQRTTEVCESD